MDFKKQLLENRLAFITCHREKRESLPGVELFHGQPGFFKNAFLFKKNALKKVPANFQLHVPDWVSIDDVFLEGHGWHFSEAMIYMVLKNTPDNWSINPQLNIEKMKNEKDLVLFCQTQSRGFSGDDIENNEWYPAILASSQKNFRKSNHQFYLASLKGQTAGVALAYFTGKTIGLYSVTTVARFRNQGVSTGLMKAMVRQGLEQGAECVTLQTMAGTYAESFYKKLGFEAGFECRIFKKQA